ncbi:sulfotransferase family cytosolic 1B member 1-like isoform X2 [Portunus trituberculatus]|uniref:sulfotransferase family cytosolic 1B member 1-like isoform X2 n=1 Tax=Portunus trituberculatus TaxID=210409 RepID=UPI001E1CDD35|nr:sulfotransferase family cytosolic 1B member 1-like isoform X2 [Portunus trituberculatus]
MSRQLLSGHKVEQASEEEVKKMEMVPFVRGIVRILPEGWLYSWSATNFLNKIYNMKFRSDDVIVMTFPKCGTTWMQEIVWTMLHNPNLDNPEADESLWLRSHEISMDMHMDIEHFKGKLWHPIMEKFEKMCPGGRIEDGVCLQILEASPGPRVMKCHYPFSLLPPDMLQSAKVVYVTRNPKDMMVSFYWFWKESNSFQYRGNFENCIRQLMTGSTLFTPYWPHVKEAWQKRHHSNVHFVFYEDLKADTMLELKKLNDFLGTRLSEEKLEAVAQHTSFSSMSKAGVNQIKKVYGERKSKKTSFFRKGITGDWKNHFSPELQEEVDRWIEKNVSGTDISLRWALWQ